MPGVLKGKMRSIGNRKLVVLVIGILTVALAAAYYLFDPAKVRWMPRCIWRVTTGTDCPGCGSQRMAHALLHGDLSGAWHANAYALCMIPVIIFLLWLEFAKSDHPELYAKVHHHVVITSLVFTIFLWWVLRNLI